MATVVEMVAVAVTTMVAAHVVTACVHGEFREGIPVLAQGWQMMLIMTSVVHAQPATETVT